MTLIDHAFTAQNPDAAPDREMTPDEFLAWAAAQGHEFQGYKVELARGKIIKMMNNVTRGHAEICSNLIISLGSKIDLSAYSVTTADFGVKLRRSVRFPDILVEPVNAQKKERASTNPVFIAEVLSPSSVATDFIEKMPEYTALPSLQAYLVCSQDEPIAWLFARGEDGAFADLPSKIQGRDAAVIIPAMSLELPMAEIYRGIPDPVL
jgi:Uma2 family endonuclease